MQWSLRSPGVLIGGVVAIVVAMAAAAWWVLGSSDAILFDHLDSAQLNSIAAELDRADIHYKIDREKSAIIVADSDTRRARLLVMSSANALRDTVGFELFDKSDFGMTDFAQKINYQRAIEGEIARTISALADIKYARVHLVLPEHSLFRDGQQKPRASVTIFANHQRALASDRVQGIQRITASAVPELAEQDVTVIDQNGNVLSGFPEDEATAIHSSARLAHKQAMESYLQEKARSVLMQAVGAGHFAVSVDVTLDLNQKTTNIEKVLDAGQNVGVKKMKQTSNTSRGENGNDDISREVEYAVGHESEQVIQGAGQILKLQVGVIVDSDVSDVDAAKLRELVSTAIGLDTARGDQIAIVQNKRVVQKAIEQLAASPESAEQKSIAFAWWLPIALLAVGMMVGAITTGVLSRRRRRARDELTHQQLRRQLQQWLEVESLQTEQS